MALFYDRFRVQQCFHSAMLGTSASYECSVPSGMNNEDMETPSFLCLAGHLPGLGGKKAIIQGNNSV